MTSSNMNSEADVEVLTKILDGMMKLSSELDIQYTEISRKLIEQVKLRKKLSFTSNRVLISVPPVYSWDKLQELSLNIKRLSGRLQQMKVEQQNSRNESKKAFDELQAERKTLLREIEKLQMRLPKRIPADNGLSERIEQLSRKINK